MSFVNHLRTLFAPRLGKGRSAPCPHCTPFIIFLNPGLQTGYELCYIVPTLQKGVDRQWRADTSLVEERHGMASEN